MDKYLQTSILAVTILYFSISTVQSQSSCSGNLGEPVFNETFGTGARASLESTGLGTTTYCYEDGSGVDTSCCTPGAGQGGQGCSIGLNDAEHTLFSGNINDDLNDAWHDVDDHTPDDTDGRMAVFNASEFPGEFYRRTVNGLCGGTTFEFSAWIINLYNPDLGSCPNATGLPVNVSFELWADDGNAGDAINGQLLEEVTTGDINGTTTPIWQQFSVLYEMNLNETSVVVILRNNGPGGCGNDLAIDDIQFRACGPTATVNQETTIICPDRDATFSANIGAGFPDPYFRWQKYNEATDDWDDIGQSGSESDGFNEITVSNPANGDRYRYVAAGDSTSLANPNCPIISDEFLVETVDLSTDVDASEPSSCSIRGSLVDLVANIPPGSDADGLVGTAPYTIVWKDPNGNEISTNTNSDGEDVQQVNTAGFPEGNNTWTVEVTDDNGCFAMAEITVEYCILAPVRLTHFSGEWLTIGEQAELNWVTASEINNEKFILHRSNGNTDHFEPITEIEGAGNSTETIVYSYTDNVSIGYDNYFYYLEQIDYDGTNWKSDIIQLKNSEFTDKFYVFTAPDKLVNVNVELMNEAYLQSIQIYNASGALMHSEQIGEQLNSGFHRYTLPNSSFSNGFYVAVLVFENKTEYVKFIVN